MCVEENFVFCQPKPNEEILLSMKKKNCNYRKLSLLAEGSTHKKKTFFNLPSSNNKIAEQKQFEKAA